jgi:hypothetical protein
VSLRRSPTRTAAFLAANRRNALKSTGPRTVAGKARVALNSVRQGRRAFRLRQNLMASGAREQVALYDWILGSICRCYDISRDRDGRPRYGTPQYGRQVEGMARWVFATYARAQAAWLQAKPESPLAARRFTNALPLRIRIDNATRTRRLAFWLQPGRGPNYFQPPDKLSIARRYKEVCRRRGLRPRAEVLAGLEPQVPEVEVRDQMGRRLVAEAEPPEAPFAGVAKLLAGLDTAVRAARWARCRILPPTPRVMIYRRMGSRENGNTDPHGFLDYSSQCFPGMRRRAQHESHSDPATSRTYSSQRPRGRNGQIAARRPLTGPRRAGRPSRTHAFFPGWSRGNEGARKDADRPPTSTPVQRFLSGIVGALSGWVRKFPSSLRTGSRNGMRN